MKYFISIDEQNEDRLGQGGGKFARLARLHQEGYLVPRGWGMTSEGWEDFLFQAGLWKKFQKFCQAFPEGKNRQELLSTARQIRERLSTTPLPPALLEELKEVWDDLKKPLAIRSSGLEEDSSHASFAGIHTSFLSVETLPEAKKKIRQCWCSVLSDGALFYRWKQNSRQTPSFRIGIILQEMVNVDWKGVLFTVNPLFGRREMMLEIHPPGGEEKVQNLSLDRQSGKILKEHSPKEKGLDYPRNILPRLATLGLEIEKLWQSPQDIEWALSGGEIYLLQSRPITALPEKGEKVYWTAANSQEVLWRPVTPLTFSFFLPLIDRGRREVFESLDIEEDFTERQFLRLFYGRPYFNVNYFNQFLESLQISAPDLFDTLIFGGNLSWEGTIEFPPLSRQTLRLARRALSMRRGASQKLARFSQWFEKRCQEARFTSLPASKDPEELLEFIKGNTTLMEKALSMHVLGSALAGIYYLGLGKLLDYFNVKEEGHWSSLASGIRGIRSAQEGRWMMELAQKARQWPAVRWAFEKEKARDLPEILPTLPGGPAFLREVDDFLDTFGHRSLMEADLSQPRWREDPTFVFQTIGRYLEMEGRKIKGKDNVRRRRYLRRKVLHQVSRQSFWDRLFPWKQTLVRHFIDSLAEFMPYRENLKDLALKPLYQIRRALLELEEYFLEEGVLKKEGDIFFIEWSELEILCRGDRPNHLLEAIEKARREYEHHSSLLPPRTIVVGEERGTKVSKKRPPQPGTLSGLGCSPGVVSGPARVVINNDNISHLRPDEILVTRTADPSMTPVFLMARAVIMDVGGALSHSVVVAREYGIPCVVGLGRATERIETGDYITVDGTRGVVYLDQKKKDTKEKDSPRRVKSLIKG